MHKGKHRTSGVIKPAAEAALVPSSDSTILKFLTFEELASVVPFSKSTLRRLIKAGDIAKYQPGGMRHRMAFHPDVVKSVATGKADSKPTVNTKSNSPHPRTQPEETGHHTLPGPKPSWAQRFSTPTFRSQK